MSSLQPTARCVSSVKGDTGQRARSSLLGTLGSVWHLCVLQSLNVSPTSKRSVVILQDENFLELDSGDGSEFNTAEMYLLSVWSIFSDMHFSTV